MVGFAPGWKQIDEPEDGTVHRIPKDTMRNVEDTGEFVVNVVSRGIAEQMNTTSAGFDFGVSEFEKAGLTPIASTIVKPYAVKEALVSFECKLIELYQYGNNNLVLGEVVGIRLEDSVINERMHVNAEILDAVGRLGGSWYCTTRDRFQISRPVRGE